jgi:hypothetical protein
MITLDDFQVYKFYLAIKLHFTTDDYDFFKFNGKTTASRVAFEKRKDMVTIRKLAKKLDTKDVVNYFVANFVSGDKSGGAFDNTESERIFKEWQKRIESLSYQFITDLGKLSDECERVNKNFSHVFEIEKGTHPLLLRMYLGYNITIETMVILNSLQPYIDSFDKYLYNDIIWNEISRIIKKYEPFLHYDKKKLSDAYRSRNSES